MIYTLEDFISEYSKIKDIGWIKTHRAGPTGVGKTLEDLLGIEENNNHAPDFGEYELKSCRIGSVSMLTMFTQTPRPAKANTYLREKYGYSSNAYDNDSKVLHSTLTASRFVNIADTGHALKIECLEDRIAIASENGLEDVYWDREELHKSFNKKYTNKFVYAKAYTRGSGSNEEFDFDEAYEVSGFSYASFVKLLEEGKIYVDLRIGQYPDGRTHDHGTGFRIKEIDQPELFLINKRIV